MREYTKMVEWNGKWGVRAHCTDKGDIRRKNISKNKIRIKNATNKANRKSKSHSSTMSTAVGMSWSYHKHFIYKHNSRLSARERVKRKQKCTFLCELCVCMWKHSSSHDKANFKVVEPLPQPQSEPACASMMQWLLFHPLWDANKRIHQLRVFLFYGVFFHVMNFLACVVAFCICEI